MTEKSVKKLGLFSQVNREKGATFRHQNNDDYLVDYAHCKGGRGGSDGHSGNQGGQNVVQGGANVLSDGRRSDAGVM